MANCRSRLRPLAYPPLRRATYCFFWTRKPHELNSVQFQCIPAGHPPGRRRCDRPTGRGRSGHGRCVSVHTVASRCVSSYAPSGLRVRQAGPSDFIRCESRPTGPVGASNPAWPRISSLICRSRQHHAVGRGLTRACSHQSRRAFHRRALPR
jgi:hypothetical protein